jgi:hypothetical protein
MDAVLGSWLWVVCVEVVIEEDTVWLVSMEEWAHDEPRDRAWGVSGIGGFQDVRFRDESFDAPESRRELMSNCVKVWDEMLFLSNGDIGIPVLECSETLFLPADDIGNVSLECEEMAFLSNGSRHLCSGKDGNSEWEAFVLVVLFFPFCDAKKQVVRMGDLGHLSSLQLSRDIASLLLSKECGDAEPENGPMEAGLANRRSFACSDPGDCGVEMIWRCWLRFDRKLSYLAFKPKSP